MDAATRCVNRQQPGGALALEKQKRQAIAGLPFR